MGAKLIQLTGARASYALEKKITTIGRGPDNDIVIRDERVSKEHARIVKLGTEYYLEDLDSRNGTFFEGKSVLKVHLQTDDEFQLGPIAFQFVMTSEAEKAEHVSSDYSELRDVQRGSLPSWVYFYYPVIRALNNGEIVSTVVAFVFQLVGVLLLAGGVYSIIDFLKLVFQMPTEVTIGGIIMGILQLAAFLAIVEVFFYRARNIKDLGASSYTVIPIFGYLFRAVGESLATYGVATAVGGCVYIWFGGDPVSGSTAGLFHLAYPERIFLSGLVYLLLMVASSFASLIVAYLFAESFVVVVDIEKNVRALRTRAEHVGNE